MTTHPWVTGGGGQVRFGVSMGADPDPAAMRDRARELEELGFDAVFVPDHPSVLGDPWVTLAGLADATSRVRLGVLAACASYRHPAVLARVAADLDRIFGGRSILGVGSGDMPHEFGMLGLDHGTAATRRRALGRTLRVLPALLRGERVVDEDAAVLDLALPFPAVQQPGVPILVAGGGRGTLRLAAAHADAVNIGASGWSGGARTTDDIAARFEVLREECAAVGRSYDAVLRTGFVGVSLADTTEEAHARLAAMPPPLRAFFGDLFVAGTPDEIAAHLETMVDAGFRYLVFLMADGFVGARAMTHRLVADVLPRLRGASHG